MRRRDISLSRAIISPSPFRLRRNWSSQGGIAKTRVAYDWPSATSIGATLSFVNIWKRKEVGSQVVSLSLIEKFSHMSQVGEKLFIHELTTILIADAICEKALCSLS